MLEPLHIIPAAFRHCSKDEAEKKRSPTADHDDRGKRLTPAATAPAGNLCADMLVLADAFRLNDATRAALTAYDAKCLEDFSLMTQHDFEGMVVFAARVERPLCPLQQRKVAVLLQWVTELKQNTATMASVTNDQEKTTPSFWQRLESAMDYRTTSKNIATVDDSSAVITKQYEMIPQHWEKTFHEDLPRLKQKLKECGETQSWSLFSDSVITLRWILCGYER